MPAAEAAADEYHDRQLTGLVCLLVSVVAVGVAVGRIVYREDNDPGIDVGPQPDALDGALLIGGLIAYAFGLQQVASAQPYLYDAINIYNDSVEGFVPGPPAGGTWVPPTAPPTAAPPTP